MMFKYGVFGLTMLAALPAAAGHFVQTNLVSDGAVPAAVTDPNLQNPWGVSYAPGGPFWVSDNANGLSTLYNGSGAIQGLVVTIPPASGTGAGSPSGQVFNGSSTDFVVKQGSKSGAASFLFDSEDGTISGWSFSVNSAQAVIAVNNGAAGSVYKGLAIYTNGSGTNYLLATDFWSGVIDVYDGSFNLVTSFRDTKLPNKFSPYNVAVLGGKIYVTYGVVDAARHDSISGVGFGAVEQIDITGAVSARYIHGFLNAPWGLAIAPAGFGRFAGDLLVGNFGDGRISVYDASLKPMGRLKDSSGTPISIDGLWALIVGNGGSGGSASNIYFTAGPNGETDGLLGSIAYSK